MANRKDGRGRVLKSGESQRKDGTYEYKYTDAEGKRHSIYSRRLTPSDKYVDGKPELSLREKIAEIQKDLSIGIIPRIVNKITFHDCYIEFINTKQTLKPRTINQYEKIYKKHIQQHLGHRYIADFKYSDIVNFYIGILQEQKYSLSTLQLIQRVVHPVFELAVLNDYIRKNPSHGVFKAIKEISNLKPPKVHALTKTQQKTLLDYVRTSKRYDQYYNLLVVLLGTGCRIGEALGLCISDCDFQKNVISINHIIGYYPCENERSRYHILFPKTPSSCRDIPMIKVVRDTLLAEICERSKKKMQDYNVDGYTDFVFIKNKGKPYHPDEIRRVLLNICRNYNSMETVNAQREQRDPVLLPRITPHMLRHTFCTRYCEVESNLKIIQEIMGHSNILTTMQIYNEATEDAKRESLVNLDSKFDVLNP